MLKRGQITIFIILGIVIIAIIGFVLALRTDIVKSTVQKAASLAQSFTSQANEVQGIAEDCLKLKLQEATVLLGNKKLENYEDAVSGQIKGSLAVCLDFSSVENVDVSREGDISVITELSPDKSSISATATVNLEVSSGKDHQSIGEIYAEYSFVKRCCVPVKVDSGCSSKDVGIYNVCGFEFNIQEGDSVFDMGGNCIAC